MLSFFLAMVAGIFIFALNAEFSRKETVVGFLSPDKGLVRVMALKPGLVKQMFVSNGDSVKEGDRIALIEVDAVSEGGAVMAQVELENIARQQEEITNQISAQEDRFASEEQSLKERIRNLQDRMENINSGLEIQKTVLSLASQDISRLKQLNAKGFAAKADIEKRQSNAEAERLKLQNMNLELLQHEGEMENAMADMGKLPMERQIALSELRSRSAELGKIAASAQSNRSYEVKAPIDGIVDLVQITVGQQVNSAIPIVSILPSGANLRANLFLPSRAIANIEPGQSIRISYDAFPYLRFGFSHAKLEKISYTLLSPNEVSIPLNLKEPVYRLDAALEDQRFHSKDRIYPLLAGFSVAFISDTHVGSPHIDLEKIRSIVEETNALQPDLILLGGDYGINGVVGGHTVLSTDIVAILSKLMARYGVFGVLGNHDWWNGAPRIRQEFNEQHIQILEDDARHIAIGNRGFWIAGVSDYTEGAHDIGKALSVVTGSDPIIIFSHSPDIFPNVPSHIGLTIAGHTHGGQVYVPFLGRPIIPSKYGQRYAKGMIEEEGKQLFVGSGIGTSILPMRFLTPPEVSILKLYPPPQP